MQNCGIGLSAHLPLIPLPHQKEPMSGLMKRLYGSRIEPSIDAAPQEEREVDVSLLRGGLENTYRKRRENAWKSANLHAISL